MTTIAAGELVARVLRATGTDAVYGEPLAADASGGSPRGAPSAAPLAVTPVPAALAPLFAAAHQRVHATRAAFHHGEQILRFEPVDAGPDPAVSVSVASADELIEVVGLLGHPGAIEMTLQLDLREPVADAAPAPAAVTFDDAWRAPVPETVDALGGAPAVTVLAGPGVVRHRAVAGLHDLAQSAGLGVLNTWGAKGVFDWRSRHHLATVGLQGRDYELGGLGDVDLIVATGLDRRESPPGIWDLAPAVHVHPGALGPLAESHTGPRRSPAPVPLRARLADVTQRGWASTGAPLAPARVTMHYGECLAPAGLVAADAGGAGFWVARTFATTRVGAVALPPAPRPGFAAACVAVARIRRPQQPALAVVDGPVDEPTAAVLDAAAALGVVVPVEAWCPDGVRLDADAHRSRLARLVLAGSPGAAVTLATDASQMEAVLEAAGPVVAWT